jgi:hypothetical protein
MKKPSLMVMIGEKKKPGGEDMDDESMSSGSGKELLDAISAKDAEGIELAIKMIVDKCIAEGDSEE